MTRRLVVALVLFVMASESTAAQMSDEGWIAYNQDQLRSRLPDPESARFRDVFISRKAGVPVACGEVSARTVTGEYSEHVRFVGAGSLGAFLPGDVDDFEALWRHFCH